MNETIIWIRSWLYLFAFVIWTAVVAVLGMPLLVTRRSSLIVIRLWVRGIMVLARVICRIDCRVEGHENVPPGAAIMAAQHQSSFETYRLWLDFERPVFVLKRELTFIPIIGWYMYCAGLVPINRGAGASAMRKMLRAADDAVARGEQVIVFPEGTRTAPGAFTAYKPGVVALYNHCEVPVVPVAINSGYCWGKTRILKRPGLIQVKILPALPAGLGKAEMLQALRDSIDGAGLPQFPEDFRGT